jgi:hypothetical protein
MPSQVEERMEVLLTGLTCVNPGEVFTHEVVPTPTTPSSNREQIAGAASSGASPRKEEPPLSDWLHIRCACTTGLLAVVCELPPLSASPSEVGPFCQSCCTSIVFAMP